MKKKKTKVKKKKGITPKQKRFAEEYIVDLNATQAAIRTGYSKNTAYSQGQRLLKNVEIKQYIDELIEKRSSRTAITSDNVLKEIAKMAFANIIDLYDSAGRLKNVSDLDLDIAVALQEVSEDVIGEMDGAPIIRKKYKMSNKTKNLELLGKHLKLFTDKIEITDKTVRLVKKRFDGSTPPEEIKEEPDE